MGVPALFRWLSQKYPKIISPVIEEQPREIDGQEIPIDTRGPNPNGEEFDNLYLDMNGIVHPCSHPEDRPAPKDEEEMMLAIFKYTDRVVNMVRPRKLLLIAIDGVAPRAKMNQQRSRRFRSAQEAEEKAADKAELLKMLKSQGGHIEEPEIKKAWDSNEITPGTPFMDILAASLRYWISYKLNTDPAWAKMKVIISDSTVPGEGEHKIMEFIRSQRSSPDHDPNTRHVIYGLDADLIMLGLGTHEPHFRVLREDVFAQDNKPRTCHMCGQPGHEARECTGKAKVKDGEFDEKDSAVFTPGWVRGFGKDKEGFCGRCEPGVWHKMDDLSYENDLTYRHGIDSSGIPLSRPSSIRRNEDGGSGWEGYCEDCGGWKTIRATKLGWNWFRHCVREHKWGGVLKPVDVAVGNSQAEAMKTLTKHVLAKEFPQAESIIDQQPWTLEFRDYRGRSILHLAAEVGHLQTVEVILAACSRVSGLKSMADLIDASSVEGETSLMIAATQGNHDVLNMLISRGASLDSTSNDGKTALDFAAEAGYQRIVVDLVRGHANTGISHVYNQLRLQALRAAKRKSVSGAENIQEVPKEAKDAESYNTPLMMASAAGDVGKVELLLEGGVDIEECTSEGENALMVAAAHRHMEVMGMLLKHGANIDATNTKGWTTLMLSVRSNDEKTVRLLLSLGADVNHLSPDRWTALAEATFQGQTAIIALLLENGADTESKSSHDWTPLMHAAYKGDEEAVMLLLDAGAAMNTSSLHDETAILLAAAGSHTRIASILLKAGCAPEPAWALSSFPSENKGPLNEGEGKAHDRATVGWTPLMLACQNGLEDVVEMLLAKNVNLEPQSPYRKTALVIAKENGRATIARMLEEYTMGSRS